MKRLAIFVFPLFLLTGCFEILENFKFNADGSGSLKFIVNMSQSKTKLKSIMLMDEVNGHKVPSKAEITNQINDVVKYAKMTKGISNVSKKVDFENFIFTFSCDFASSSSFNKMIQNIRKGKEKKSINYEEHISISKDDKLIKRNFTFAWTKKYLTLSEEDKDVLDKATFTGVYKLDKEVVNNSNPKAKIAANKKAVMVKLGFKAIINKSQTIKNQIKYK